MHVLANALCGLIFGIGLVISGMIDPAKVTNFLDLAGAWDPSLAFVMAGAVAVTAIGYRLLRGRPRPLLAPAFAWPTATVIDRPLLAGAALFGIGWGLAGLCPGPALTALPLGHMPVAVFVVAMFAGMFAARRVGRPLPRAGAEPTSRRA